MLKTLFCDTKIEICNGHVKVFGKHLPKRAQIIAALGKLTAVNGHITIKAKEIKITGDLSPHAQQVRNALVNTLTFSQQS